MQFTYVNGILLAHPSAYAYFKKLSVNSSLRHPDLTLSILLVGFVCKYIYIWSLYEAHKNVKSKSLVPFFSPIFAVHNQLSQCGLFFADYGIKY